MAYDPEVYEPRSSEGVRLQKALANAGVASRRVCEELIIEGRVKVNGVRVQVPGARQRPQAENVFTGFNLFSIALEIPTSVLTEDGKPQLIVYRNTPSTGGGVKNVVATPSVAVTSTDAVCGAGSGPAGDPTSRQRPRKMTTPPGMTRPCRSTNA